MYSFVCTNCGVTFTAKNSSRKYCSLDCRDAYNRGSNHRLWSGGKNINPQGYKRFYIRDHWLSKYYKSKHIQEHIFVVAEFLGEEKFSELKKTGFVIHHIDGNKLNNSLDNLFVCGREKHAQIEKELNNLAYKLVQQGLIIFEHGEYCCPLLSDKEGETSQIR